MVHAVPDILSRIVDHKRAALASMADVSGRRADLEKRAAGRKDYRDFRTALTANPPAILAEIKKASPSMGVFTDRFDPSAIATTYQRGGAAALSVLTDEEFFKGSLSNLETARATVNLPVLRKDFTIDEFQIVEAAAHGADAILLIAAILDAPTMRRFRELAAQLGMASLVEVHNESELEVALESGPDILGVNNRNLHTFEVTLETSLRLAEKIPAGVVKVSESGIRSSADVRRLMDAGFQSFLVGEHLMKSEDPTAALQDLRK